MRVKGGRGGRNRDRRGEGRGGRRWDNVDVHIEGPHISKPLTCSIQISSRGVFR